MLDISFSNYVGREQIVWQTLLRSHNQTRGSCSGCRPANIPSGRVDCYSRCQVVSVWRLLWVVEIDDEPHRHSNGCMEAEWISSGRKNTREPAPRDFSIAILCLPVKQSARVGCVSFRGDFPRHARESIHLLLPKKTKHPARLHVPGDRLAGLGNATTITRWLLS